MFIATILSVVLVLVIAAAFLWFLGQLGMLDAGLLRIIRAVIYIFAGLYALFAVVGLLTGHAYVPLVPVH